MAKQLTTKEWNKALDEMYFNEVKDTTETRRPTFSVWLRRTSVEKLLSHLTSLENKK